MIVEPPAQPASRPRSSGKVVPHRPTLLQRFAARLIHRLVEAIAATLRYRWESDSVLPSHEGRPYIFCLWHNRVPLAVIMYRHYLRTGTRPFRMAAMVSASRDGALLSRVLELLKVQPVRGSSSRRGAQALLELNTWLERGYDVAITVDGPRGPRYHVKPGVIGLAQVAGRPIVPSSYRLTRKWTVKSWDGFQIPVPFSTCYLRFASPVEIPRDASVREKERLRLEVEARLKALTAD